MHPDWDPSRVTDRGNDLLLIRLSAGAVTTFIEDGDQKVLPVCLPWGQDEAEYLKGKEGRERSHFVAGWGKDIQVFAICWVCAALRGNLSPTVVQ